MVSYGDKYAKCVQVVGRTSLGLRTLHRPGSCDIVAGEPGVALA